MTEPWFNENLFGALWGALVGGVGGSLCGVWGALVGIFAPRGQGRVWLLGAGWVFVGLGVLSLLFGVYALAAGQPFGIWFIPCLTGLILIAIMCGLIPVARRRYAEAEARRLEAEAFRRH